MLILTLRLHSGPLVKWVEMQQQLIAGVKGTQSTQPPHIRDPIRVREGTVKVPVPAARDPNDNVIAKTAMQPEIIKLRPGGMTKTRSNTIIAKDGGAYAT